MLTDRVAVVTGAAQGIGFAIARMYCRHNATVIVADMDPDAAQTAASELGTFGRADWQGCNVTDEDSVRSLFETVIAKYGRVDILVNNAGITRDAPVHKMSYDQFRQVLDVHLCGAWLGTRAALSHMRSRDGGGAIINMSSTSGKIGNFGQTNYSTAKAGVIGLTKSSAKEGARLGIRVNAVQPGLIRTAMTESMPPEIWQSKLVDVPLGRAGEPDEVAAVALFLASDLSSYVTGTVVEVGGGRAM